MHVSACFLLVLNAIIGFVEGRVIARYCGVPKRRAVAIMIGANYISAWAGVFLLELTAAQLQESVFRSHQAARRARKGTALNRTGTRLHG